MKRIVSAVVLVSIILSVFASCGSTEAFVGKEKSWYSDEKEPFEDLEFINELDVDSIYDNLEYNELMLNGRYMLEKKSNLKAFVKNSEFMKLSFYAQWLTNPEKMTAELTALPYTVIAGKYNIYDGALREMYYPLRFTDNNNIALLYFANKKEQTAEVLCTYEVSDRKVTYYPVESYTATTDEEGKYVSCEYTPGTTPLEYSFDIRGPYLTLSSEKGKATLCSYCFGEDTTIAPSVKAYALEDSPLVSDVINFESGAIGAGALRSGENIWKTKAKFDSNGLVTLVWQDNAFGDEGTKYYSKQLVYIATGVGLLYDGQYVFADENKVYYYTDNFTQFGEKQMDGVAGEDTLNAMSSKKLEEIVKKKGDLFADLAQAFKEKGLKVRIDRTLGEVALEDTVLFAGDSSDLTEEGKQLLDVFCEVCKDIVLSEKYKDFITGIIVEGHTAPLAGSTYESGYQLSYDRSDAVLNYCVYGTGNTRYVIVPDFTIGSNSGPETRFIDEFKNLLTEKGMSNSKPVYDSDGNVDMEASRRVSFVFVVNPEATE